MGGCYGATAFVKDVLFPYVRSHVASYVRNHYFESETQEDIRALVVLALADQAAANDPTTNPPFPPIPTIPISTHPSLDHADILSHPHTDTNATAIQTQQTAIVANVLAQMDVDRKSTALKQLQGHVNSPLFYTPLHLSSSLLSSPLWPCIFIVLTPTPLVVPLLALDWIVC